MRFANENEVLKSVARLNLALKAWLIGGTIGFGIIIAIGHNLSTNALFLAVSGFLIWALLGFAISDFFGSEKWRFRTIPS